MGREIRRVPPNWSHPKIERNGRVDDQPMYDKRFDDVFSQWIADFDRIRRDDLTDDERRWYPLGLREWLLDEGSPPDHNYYRPWRDAEATWFQLWQTVSEGSPVSPPFETKQELADYLAIRGDFWDQNRGDGGWGQARANAFVEAEWAPSLAVVSGPSGQTVLSSRDIPLAMAERKT